LHDLNKKNRAERGEFEVSLQMNTAFYFRKQVKFAHFVNWSKNIKLRARVRSTEFILYFILIDKF